MKIIIAFLFLHLVAFPGWALGAGPGKLDPKKYLEASLDDLLGMTVTTASNVVEKLSDAPATMVVITDQEIKQRGYTDLAEVLTDLPGFDVMISNDASYMTVYQRGYRTTFTSRTLFMINGVVDNLLWSHEAAISRQYPLSNIKKIEVLYGPASAIYGPNAFLGVINIITYDGKELNVGDTDITVNALGGSYKSMGTDVAVRGKPSRNTSFSITGRVYKSDEPDFTGKFGFLKEEQYSDINIWGPLLEYEHAGRSFGSYYDPTFDYGLLADFQYKGLKLGLIQWTIKEAYGPGYAADRGQNNSFWNKSSTQYFLEYEKDITDKIKGNSMLLYRESRRWGLWAEAEPDTAPGMEDYSYISLTQWNSISNSWLFKQNFEVSLLDNLNLSSGMNFERKELTKAYDVPGYWCPAIGSTAVCESGIGHSKDDTYTPPPGPLSEMPAYNLAYTDDIGGYVQSILDVGRFRFNTGIRYDYNSMYGGVVNPRVAAIFKHSKPWTFKLLYGEAVQEPPPQLLWGGWSGRNSNTNLKPEKVRNTEFVAMHQIGPLFHEVSLYYAHYSNVIKEEAENAGSRDIYGVEYRAKATFPNFIPNSTDITGYFNYTFTHAISSVNYDQDLGDWVDGDTILGDIAPHKFNIGMNLPVRNHWNLNLRGNFVGERELYSRNPLRAQGETLDSHFVFNGTLSYVYEWFDISFKVLNILDEDYFIPGGASADSGNDFTQRSAGYFSSIIPRAGRSYWVNLRMRF